MSDRFGVKVRGRERARITIPQILADFVEDYPIDLIKRTLISQWAALNELTDKTLTQSARIEELLSGFKQDRDALTLGESVKRYFPALSLKQIEQSFEYLGEKERQQSHGVVYTPDYIINYLIHHALGYGWKNSQQLPKICDPACGVGGFLIRAADILHQQYKLSLHQVFAESLVGIDVDPWAIEHARIVLELYLLQNRVRLSEIEINLIEADALLTPVPTLLGMANAASGFDIVVTNPPYVKLQNLELDYRTALMAEFPRYTNGTFSLSLLFLIRCHALLAAQGCSAMITQNNLFTSLAGREVRDYLQDQRCLRQIVDFGHHKVFENASAYTCLIFLGRQPTSEFEYATLAGSRTVDRETLDAMPLSTISVENLDAKKWRLAKPKHYENLKRIESTGKPLGHLTSIRVGFATLKDSVFIVEQEGDTCKPKRGKSEYQIELAITKPALRVSDITSAAQIDSDLSRVIFPYKKINGSFVLIAEEEFSNTFPRAFEYLSANREALLNRDKQRKSYAGWYAWGRTQSLESPGPKLLTKTFSRFPQFLLDSTDHLFCNGYGLFPKAATLFDAEIPLDALARILNSKVMHYYARLTSFQIEGNYQCYQKNFIERCGIPSFTASDIDAILGMSTTDLDEYLSSIYRIEQADIDEITKAFCGDAQEN